MRRHIILLSAILMSYMALGQSWEIIYPQTDVVVLTTGVSNDDGHYIFGWSRDDDPNGKYTAYAMYVGNDGGYIYSTYQDAAVRSKFLGSVCLDDGNAFVAGVKSKNEYGDVFDSLWIAIINPDLEIVGEHTYAVENPYFLIDYTCLVRENEGDVVLAAKVKGIYPNSYHYQNDCLACRFDVHGNMLDSEYNETPLLGIPDVRDMSIVPNTDNIMVMDSGYNPTGFPCVSYMNKDLRFFSHHDVLDGRWQGVWINGSSWLDDTHFLMAGMMWDRDVPERDVLCAVFKCDTALRVWDTFVYDRRDTADYIPNTRALEYVNDSTIYFVSYHEPAFDGTSTDCNDATVFLLDKDMNLLGSKFMEFDDRVFAINHIQKTADDGILMYGFSKAGYNNEVYVKKILREDVFVPCHVAESSKDNIVSGAFPNPAKDVLNLKVNKPENQAVTLLISNVEGRKIVEREFVLPEDSIVSLDVSSFKEGVYFYKILDGKNSSKGKFIKE